MVTARPDGPAPAPRPRRRLWLATTAVGLALLLWAWLRPAAAPPDPRRTYAGPFQNIHPDVRYVADSGCADCHVDIARTFAAHPMGRSLLPVADAPSPPDDARHHNPFTALDSQFRVEREGDRVWHRRTRLAPDGRPAAEQAWAVQYVIGSGTRGHSYLTAPDGYVLQTPVSWYSQTQRWDLSPGFSQPLATGRSVPPECLFCHANRAEYVEGSVNRYAEPVFDGHAIGCQRCHGPGALHAAARAQGEPVAGKVDYTIVNPRHLESTRRDAVCEQCHLVGATRALPRGRGVYDFRPGLPLEWFWAIFVRAAEDGKTARAVGQVEQMYQSRCFQAAAGQLGCVSCHDPHAAVSPGKRVAHFRDRCLQCHKDHGCSLPVAERLRRTAEDSCIDCHMPRYGSADIPHTASTDHRIPRRPTPPAEADSHPGAEHLPLLAFYRSRPGIDGDAAERDRAVALVKQALTGEAAAVRALPRVVPTLEAAARRDPGDLAAGEAHGYALGLQRQWAASLVAFRSVLARAPERERALVGAATGAEESGQTEAARDYWHRAVAANPRSAGYRRSLTLLLVRDEAWDAAEPESAAWVRLDPLSAEARANRVTCLLAVGRKEEARAEFARLEALAPPNLRELQIRFAKRLR